MKNKIQLPKELLDDMKSIMQEKNITSIEDLLDEIFEAQTPIISGTDPNYNAEYKVTYEILDNLGLMPEGELDEDSIEIIKTVNESMRLDALSLAEITEGIIPFEKQHETEEKVIQRLQMMSNPDHIFFAKHANLDEAQKDIKDLIIAHLYNQMIIEFTFQDNDLHTDIFNTLSNVADLYIKYELFSKPLISSTFSKFIHNVNGINILEDIDYKELEASERREKAFESLETFIKILARDEHRQIEKDMANYKKYLPADLYIKDEDFKDILCVIRTISHVFERNQEMIDMALSTIVPAILSKDETLDENMNITTGAYNAICMALVKYSDDYIEKKNKEISKDIDICLENTENYLLNKLDEILTNKDSFVAMNTVKEAKALIEDVKAERK